MDKKEKMFFFPRESVLQRQVRTEAHTVSCIEEEKLELQATGTL